ncbi:hypothetical protein BU23DRAFT_476847, partial [Bimuria novae-zelandiae CBS 107.79]
FLIILGNKNYTEYSKDFIILENIIHQNFIKSKRVTRIVLASELYKIVRGFNNVIILSINL